MLQKEWADSLNPAMPDSSTTLLATLMEEVYNASGFQQVGNSSGIEGELQAQASSLVLSAVVADALGRISSELNLTWGVVICRNGWCSTSDPQHPFSGSPVLFNGTVDE